MNILTSIRFIRNLLLLTVVGGSLQVRLQGQGYLLFVNATAPTRLGTADGPFAGNGIWGQALVGPTSASLTPIGAPVAHYDGGYTGGEVIIIPWALPGTTISIQMAAWDGGVWGTSFANVPANQLGYTDTVPILLATPLQYDYPRFTQSAIVPAVPEPASTLLLLVGVVALLFHRGLRAKLTGCRPFQ